MARKDEAQLLRYTSVQVVRKMLSSAFGGLHLHPPSLSVNLTFLYVRNGTLEVVLRYDLSDHHQQVEFAVVEVLRGAGGCRRCPGVGLTA